METQSSREHRDGRRPIGPVWVVLRREYLERVTKGFWVGTLLFPFILFALGLAALLMMAAARSPHEVALLDQTGVLANPVALGLEAAGYAVDVVDLMEAKESLNQRVVEGDIIGYMVLDELTTAEGVFTYHSERPPGLALRSLSQRVVAGATLTVRITDLADSTGLQHLLAGGQLEFRAVGGDDAVNEMDRTAVITGFVGAMLLYVMVTTYGILVLRAVMIEKSSRVVEIVLSSVQPWQLILGKVLGVGAVGLTQQVAWATLMLLLSLVILPFWTARYPDASIVHILAFLPNIGVVFLFMTFFVLGYFLYAALFATVGAVCNGEEDVAQAQLPIALLLMTSVVLQSISVTGSGIEWIDWAALFPFFSPVLMFPRAVAGAVPDWMTLVSLTLMAVTIVATAWVAGRIYRVGLLMQGKRPTVRELARWLRAS